MTHVKVKEVVKETKIEFVYLNPVSERLYNRTYQELILIGAQFPEVTDCKLTAWTSGTQMLQVTITVKDGENVIKVAEAMARPMLERVHALHSAASRRATMH